MLNDETLSECCGYQDQLERARRALQRMHGPSSTPLEFQDSSWSFFQHCWHLRDWLRHDPWVPEVAKVSVLERVGKSAVLQTCRALCHGSKHLRAIPAASVDLAATVTTRSAIHRESPPGEGSRIFVAGAAFANECLAEWESILRGAGLAIARRD